MPVFADQQSYICSVQTAERTYQEWWIGIDGEAVKKLHAVGVMMKLANMWRVFDGSICKVYGE